MEKNIPQKPQEIIGKWLGCTWNGMTDIFKVTKATDKMITLQEYDWATVAPLPGETANGDPTWCSTVIATNADGSFKEKMTSKIIDGKLASEPKVVRRKVIYKEGGFTMKTSWDGLGCYRIIANNDEEAKKLRWSTFWN